MNIYNKLANSFIFKIIGKNIIQNRNSNLFSPHQNVNFIFDTIEVV